jgi:hypothetical protein
VYWAEWRKDMRVRGEELEENAPREVSKMFMTNAQEAPWEVSSRSIPGLPYLGSFLKAVLVEMGNAEANAMAKKALATGASSVKAPPPSASINRQPSKMGAIIAALIMGAVALIVLWKLFV